MFLALAFSVPIWHSYLMLKRLKEIRKESGLTQKELAGRIGAARTQLVKWECGKQNISLKWLEKLAEALGVATTDLIDDGTVKISPGAGSSKAVQVATEISIACLNAINELLRDKKIPQGQGAALMTKAIRYFWDDFAKGNPPNPLAIKKFIVNIVD